VASELKALEGYCTKIQLFPPGHYMTSKDGEFVQWYKREWTEFDAVKTMKQVLTIKAKAVHRQLMSECLMGYCFLEVWILLYVRSC
jgi:asparagine synthase (glutamine-hydrolysing)